MSFGRRETIIAIVLGIVAILIVGYNYFPQSQEVVLVFSDGSEKTLRPLFQVNYYSNEVEEIKLIVNENNLSLGFQPTITTPLGTFDMHPKTTKTWNISTNEIFNYSVDEGKYNIVIQSELGKKEFDLNFKDNRRIVIEFD